MKDLKLGKAGDVHLVGVLSTSEEERVEKLGKYFRQYLSDYLEKLMQGVKFTPAVAQTFVDALLETAAGISLADPAIDDDTIERQAMVWVAEARERLDAHLKMMRQAAGLEPEPS